MRCLCILDRGGPLTRNVRHRRAPRGRRDRLAPSHRRPRGTLGCSLTASPPPDIRLRVGLARLLLIWAAVPGREATPPNVLRLLITIATQPITNLAERGP